MKHLLKNKEFITEMSFLQTWVKIFNIYPSTANINSHKVNGLKIIPAMTLKNKFGLNWKEFVEKSGYSKHYFKPINFKNCKNCGCVTTNNEFCSQSCGAKFRNVNLDRTRSKKSIKKQSETIRNNKTRKKYKIKSIEELERQLIERSLKRDEVLKETNVVFLKGDRLKRKILMEQDFKCNHCGIIDWNGKSLVLELEHIDGNNTNNSRENLECICPNCHSQTSTFRGRNARKHLNVVKITDKQYCEAFLEEGNIYKALIKLNKTPKGGNYRIIKRALTLNNIDY